MPLDNIKKWTRASLEENIRVTEDRTAWRKTSCAAGAVNVKTDDAEQIKDHKMIIGTDSYLENWFAVMEHDCCKK